MTAIAADKLVVRRNGAILLDGLSLSLGSTGSVGCNTVDLIERNRALYVIEALTANNNVELLAEQARQALETAVRIDEAVEAGLPMPVIAATGRAVA